MVSLNCQLSTIYASSLSHNAHQSCHKLPSECCWQVFDLQSGCMVDQIRVALDTVNGVSCHPYLNMLAVSTGENNKAIAWKRRWNNNLGVYLEPSLSSNVSMGFCDQTLQIYSYMCFTHSGHRRYPLSTDKIVQRGYNPYSGVIDGCEGESPDAWARGSGLENTMRVFRMETSMLSYPSQTNARVYDSSGQ